ncbi:MAG: hypothetical protein KF708_13060 [Pirellulales bacterium]|nr:hypothetical protein [Pirellulales bacterium]
MKIASHTFRPWFAFLLAALVIGLASGNARAEEQLLFDFEATPLGEHWGAFRDITVQRSAIPAPPPADASRDGAIVPAEHALHVETVGSAGLVSAQGELPTDWRPFQTLNFWVYRDPAASLAQPLSTFEVRLSDHNNKVSFWRRIEVSHEGWKRISLPLRWMRWGEGPIPRWDDVTRLAFWFRDAADLWIDSVSITPGNDAEASELSAKDLFDVAFPGGDPAKIIVIQTGDYLVMTNARDLEPYRLGRHLDEVVASVRRDLPFLDRRAGRAKMLIFATRGEYQAFTPRFAEKLGGVAPPPTSDGFTTQAVATSSWDPQFGTLRPVFTHEFVHSLVAQGTRLPNSQEWFHEGYATLVQRRFHPQANLPELVRAGLADPSLRLPLSRLCDGKLIPLTAYWQAMTVVETLLTNPKYSQHLPELLERFAEAGSTDLGPHLTDLLSSNWLQLTEDWITHCQQTYGVESQAESR